MQNEHRHLLFLPPENRTIVKEVKRSNTIIKKKIEGELLVEPTYKIVDKGEYYIPCSKWSKLINPYRVVPRMCRILGNCFCRAPVYINDISHPKAA